MTDTSGRGHVIAIVGGACSGAEAAAVLAERGVTVVVFEQNSRPFGKIEDGLPRWHDKQRAQEYDKLREKLSRPNVHFVPLTKMGRDVEFEDLAKGWGFSALLLAHGAWKDRPLGIPGVDDYVGNGLVYQNSFIYWFNHYPEKAYDGTQYEVHDDVIVMGGGLASVDVVKVLMIETVQRALAKRDIHVDMLTMERRGPLAILAEKGLSLEALGIKGCRLYYRRRMLDMPVAAYKEGATAADRAKTEETRCKLMNHAMSKFGFRFFECHLPNGYLVEDGRLVGLKMIKTEIRDNKVVELPGTELEVRGPMVISSIGSIPEPVKGIPMKGEFYTYKSWDTGELAGFPGVYGIGNVVTGKGNIAVSRRHGRAVAEHLIASYLGLTDKAFHVKEGVTAGADAATREQVNAIADQLQGRPALAPEAVEKILARVRERQRSVGYDGDYPAWIKRVTPPDLQ
jgi:ferredoxin--NADP+ reductase